MCSYSTLSPSAGPRYQNRLESLPMIFLLPFGRDIKVSFGPDITTRKKDCVVVFLFYFAPISKPVRKPDNLKKFKPATYKVGIDFLNAWPGHKKVF